jgi:phenylpropionate dioxygenase-like ring-hydroxylating dioxygenase large terminal subunit
VYQLVSHIRLSMADPSNTKTPAQAAAEPQPADTTALYWHPVLDSAALRDAPHAVQVLDQALVLWRDAHGLPHAWADRCPHRGARLSL